MNRRFDGFGLEEETGCARVVVLVEDFRVDVVITNPEVVEFGRATSVWRTDVAAGGPSRSRFYTPTTTRECRAVIRLIIKFTDLRVAYKRIR